MSIVVLTHVVNMDYVYYIIDRDGQGVIPAVFKDEYEAADRCETLITNYSEYHEVIQLNVI